ncbi:MAG: hypothetical protein KatS3mg076_3075 [Candidatus Binatia bacterium]|nr:MAG: hypothetical protein KatS3mg076_3075 [Candidatus Binatia bacterium]
MPVDDFRGKTCVVTGAASGIGRETALAFAREAANLALCDLNEEGLEEVCELARREGVDAWGARVDVSKRDEMERFAASVHARVPAVDVLVNNAGVGLGASFLDTSLEDWEWILGVNLRGVVYGCHFFLPPMVARGQGGHVVNVASAAAFVATEPLCAYATTKYAVFGLSEALRQELRRARIGVTVVCPGIVNTPITRSSALRGLYARPGVRERMVEFYRRRNYGPERVARAIVRAVRKNRAVAPVSPEAWILYYAKRFLPSLLEAVSSRQNERARREFEKLAAT